MGTAVKQPGALRRAIDGVVPLSGSRLLHLEALRLIAIVLVVFNHTSTRGFLLFTKTDNPALYVVYLGTSIVCKIAVPLFFMVSGALLIPREESIGATYKKRVLRMVIVICLAMFAMYWFTIHQGVYQFDFLAFMKMAYSSPTRIATAYWFLYAYLAVLVLLPIVRPMARAMTDRMFAYLVALQIFFVGIVPIFDYLVGYDPPFVSLPLFVESGQAFFFFVMGYFMEHRLDERSYNRRNVYLAVGAAVVALCVTAVMTWLRFRARGSAGDVQSFFGTLIAVPTLSVYFLVKYALRGRSVAPWVKGLVLWFGATAFGTYLLDSALRPTIVSVYESLQPHIRAPLACLVWVLCVVVAGSLITAALKLVPGLNRLL